MTLSLPVIEAKKNNAFSQIQAIYDLAKKTADREILIKFLSRAKSVDKLRSEFSDCLDTYHELMLQEDENYVINYAPLNSADELVDYIKSHLNSIESKMNSSKKSSELNVSAQQTSVLRLPKLELKHFNGDLNEWVSFKNLFESSIHNNTSMPQAMKLQYLLSVLSNEPLNLIKSLPISDVNYQVAYNILKERYHSPRRLASLHLNQILDLPTVNNNPTQMRHFLNMYTENTQALKGIAVDINETENPLLSTMLLRKMDVGLRRKYEHYRSSAHDNETRASVPKVDEIIKFINQECCDIEEATLNPCSPIYSIPSQFRISGKSNNDAAKVSQSTPTRQFPRSRISNRPVPPITYANVVANVNNSSKQSSKSPIRQRRLSNTYSKTDCCSYCGSDKHRIYSCPEFFQLSVERRSHFVSISKSCSNCLGHHHELSQCTSQRSCQICSKKHHSLLHIENSPEPTSTCSRPTSPQQ